MVLYAVVIVDKNGEVSAPSSILITTGESVRLLVVRVVRGLRLDVHDEGTAKEEEGVMTEIGVSRGDDLLAPSSSRGPILVRAEIGRWIGVKS